MGPLHPSFASPRVWLAIISSDQEPKRQLQALTHIHRTALICKWVSTVVTKPSPLTSILIRRFGNRHAGEYLVVTWVGRRECRP